MRVVLEILSSEVKVFEVVEASEVDGQQDGDDFAFLHLHRTISVSFTITGLDGGSFLYSTANPLQKSATIQMISVILSLVSVLILVLS